MSSPITPYADPWAATIVSALDRHYPWNSAHSASDPQDCDVTPHRLHPSFHGCLDWHSSVHMQYSAVVLLGEGVGDGLAGELAQRLDARLQPAHTQVEAEYVRARRSYERPYGWAWATQLAAACARSSHPGAPRWAEAMAPLSEVVFDNLLEWLPTLAYPVRTGVHDNTAFSLSLLLDSARELGREDVCEAIVDHAMRWFGADRDYPVVYEPSGNDFLSAALCEASLMRRVMDPGAFGAWLGRFLPRLGEADDPLLATPTVLDRTDGKSVHLFGLALSRAWHLRELAGWLDEPAARRAEAAARDNLAAVAEEIVSGDFMSTHWLVTFALRALLARETG
ncbi:DUF2891 family protein [Corynebacterium liangguodongii]|uniref:DUF2891 domain-containing protein n=1 Tax=Corynebacterium liangguodongii TaxID=2079535 RepID=A0A2S0WD39_9CORY|nr:DUF2891 family protein [Corynebacterium liangguodongii]AWB83685.1 DUF2891 domain-containing protein [Corynebacterium liangguodongii]PWB99505.1 DUF2891 domain-containing protein [Corynebacterium liangguodongii]